MTPLLPLAESFSPRPKSEEQQTRPSHTDNDLDRSLAIGMACPIEIGNPVAMADVAEPPGSAGAGGPVVAF